MKSENECREHAEGLHHLWINIEPFCTAGTPEHSQQKQTSLRLEKQICSASFNTIKQKEKSAKKCSGKPTGKKSNKLQLQIWATNWPNYLGWSYWTPGRFMPINLKGLLRAVFIQMVSSISMCGAGVHKGGAEHDCSRAFTHSTARRKASSAQARGSEVRGRDVTFSHSAFSFKEIRVKRRSRERSAAEQVHRQTGCFQAEI